VSRARLTGVLAVVAASLAVGLLLPGRAAAAVCQTSGPVSGSYTVTVCITVPANGSLVSGDQAVSATATFSGTSPSAVRRMVFYLDGRYLLTDYSSPYTFQLPSASFVDGAHTLQTEALLRDGFTTAQTSIGLQFGNGVLTPPVNTNTFTPATGTAPSAGHPFVVAAVGDGAGGEQNETNVVSQINSWQPNLFLYLGDVYEKGTSTEFRNWYDPAYWYGGLRSITNPTIGNHEYENGAAPGYFGYWDNVPHYYSYDANGWHFISLDTNSQFGQVAPGTGQYTWLAGDLANNTQPCTLVYFHHPLFNIGQEGGSSSLQPLWQLLVQHGVDLVVNGHDHTYQRWVPLDGNGNPSPQGITELVDGTGGHALGSFISTDSRVAASASAYGALRLELNPNGAVYAFVTAQGQTLDSGSVQCGVSSDSTPPTTPAGLTATAPSDGEVDLSWTPSTDAVGVTGYEVWRDEALLSSGSSASYVDSSVTPSTTYQYKVRAYDAAGNRSGFSGSASVTTPAAGAAFSDGFESGDLSKWASSRGISAQQGEVFAGSWAARAIANGSPAYATTTLSAERTELFYRAQVKVISQGANSTYLLRFRTATGSYLATLFVSSTGKLGIRNDGAAATTTSATKLTTGVWHLVQMHLLVNGGSSQADVWLDGAPVPGLSLALPLGTTPIGRLDLGDASSGRTFDVAFDDVLADSSSPSDTAPPTTPTGLAANVSGSQIDLSWAASTDNVGVVSYRVYRDGSQIATVPAPATTSSDRAVAASQTYSYAVSAMDGAGNESARSAAASATMGELALFSDDFETGDLAKWTTVAGLAVQNTHVFAGSWAARATGAGTAAWAYATLGSPQPGVYYRLRFKLISQGANNVTLLKFRTAAGASIGGVLVTSAGKLAFRNDAGGATRSSTTVVGAGSWHELEVHLVVDGASDRTEIWLDGSPVAALTAADATLGSTPIGQIQLGENATGRAYDVAFDNVSLSTGP
jgi:chitodextrinase